MSDPREALVALLNHPDHAPMSTHDPRDGSCRSCPWPLHEMPPEDIADAILAEFDVTERGEDQWWESLVEVACDKRHRIFIDDGDGGVYACPACALPPTVKPSVEDVARALWELDEQEAETTGGALGLPWSALDSLTQGTYRADAEDLLALLPGRTEAEVKAEALREFGDEVTPTPATAYRVARWRHTRWVEPHPARPTDVYLRPEGGTGAHALYAGCRDCDEALLPETFESIPPPSVEDVARLLYERFSQNRLATWDDLGDIDGGPGSTREWYRDRAREVLELANGEVAP